MRMLFSIVIGILVLKIGAKNIVGDTGISFLCGVDAINQFVGDTLDLNFSLTETTLKKSK